MCVCMFFILFPVNAGIENETQAAFPCDRPGLCVLNAFARTFRQHITHVLIKAICVFDSCDADPEKFYSGRTIFAQVSLRLTAYSILCPFVHMCVCVCFVFECVANIAQQMVNNRQLNGPMKLIHSRVFRYQEYERFIYELDAA